MCVYVYVYVCVRIIIEKRPYGEIGRSRENCATEARNNDMQERLERDASAEQDTQRETETFVYKIASEAEEREGGRERERVCVCVRGRCARERELSSLADTSMHIYFCICGCLRYLRKKNGGTERK